MSFILSTLLYLFITVLVLYLYSEYRSYQKISFYTKQGVRYDWKPAILRLFSKEKKKSQNPFEIAQHLTEVYKGEDIALTYIYGTLQVCPLTPKALKEFFEKEKEHTTRSSEQFTDRKGLKEGVDPQERSRGLFKKVYNRENLDLFRPTVAAALKDQIQVLKQKIQSDSSAGSKKVKVDFRKDFVVNFFDKMATKLALGDSPVHRSIPELENMSFHQAVSKSTALWRTKFSLANILTGGLIIKLGLSKAYKESAVLEKRILAYARKVYDEKVEAFAKGEYEPKKGNIMDYLILENDKLKKEGKDLHAREEICRHLLVIFKAGFDTAMVVFANIFLYLVNNREYLLKLREVVRNEFVGDDYTTDALVDQPFLHAVFMETNRLFPGLNRSFSKMVAKPFSLCGVKIRKGDDVAVRFVSLNYNKENFPNPEKYDPTRFVDSKPPRLGFLPFSHGARSCVGRVFGDFLIKILLVELNREFDFSFEEEGYQLKMFHSDFISALTDSTVKVEVLGN